MLACSICSKSFNDTAHKPLTVCNNGHSYCALCSSSFSSCPECREPVLPSFIINREILRLVDSHSSHNLSEIPLDHLSLHDVLSEGSFADVIDAKWRSVPVIVKKLRQTNQSLDTSSTELRSLITQSQAHPNLASVYGVTKFSQCKVGLVMEKALNSLESVIPSYFSYKSLQIAEQILVGLLFLNDKGIIHEALKPSNVLLFSDNTTKLSDFTTLHFQQQSDTQLSLYTAPETIKSNQLTSKSNVFSFGLLMYELFTGKRAYIGNTNQYILSVVEGKRPVLGTDVPKEIKSLITKCWHNDPSKRPPLAQCLDDIHLLKQSVREPKAVLPSAPVFRPPPHFHSENETTKTNHVEEETETFIVVPPPSTEPVLPNKTQSEPSSPFQRPSQIPSRSMVPKPVTRELIVFLVYCWIMYPLAIFAGMITMISGSTCSRNLPLFLLLHGCLSLLVLFLQFIIPMQRSTLGADAMDGPRAFGFFLLLPKVIWYFVGLFWLFSAEDCGTGILIFTALYFLVSTFVGWTVFLYAKVATFW
ncbi:hypothetical protein P9112_014385 [Eukaryota sp. TZLM1-RC]